MTKQSPIAARRLPGYLSKRYQGWRATDYAENQSWFRKLAEEGQRPRTMVISCCDSRVHVTSIFGAETGEFFIHRNIAALVPPYAPNRDFHGTSAAIEFAVKHLHVTNILILGHSGCGGVAACHDIAAGKAPELTEETSFIGRWLDILKPGVAGLKGTDRQERLEELEKAAVRLGLANILTFPFVRQAVDEGRLDLHGLWNEVGEGMLHEYDPATGGFLPV